MPTREGQTAVAVRFFFIGFTKVLDVVTEVEVEMVRVFVNLVVVVSVVVVVEVVNVLMTVDEPTGVRVVRVMVAGLTLRNLPQNSTACFFNSTAQTGGTF